MQITRTLQELADYLGGVVHGDGAVRVSGLAPLDNAGPDKVTFLANPKYAAKVAETGAGGVLMAPGNERYGRNVIELANPYLGFAKLLTLFYTAPHPALGVLEGGDGRLRYDPGRGDQYLSRCRGRQQRRHR